MTNKELLEKFKAIVEKHDIKEIYGYYDGESDEGGISDWDYASDNSIEGELPEEEIYELLELAVARFLGESWEAGSEGIAGTISYNAPNEKNHNGVLTLSKSVREWIQLPNLTIT